MNIPPPQVSLGLPSATLRNLHRSNPVVAQLIAQHHGEIDTREGQVAVLIKAAAKIPDPIGTDPAATIRAALDAGTLDQLDLVEAAGADADTIARWQRAHGVLSGIVSGLDAERTSAEEAARRNLPGLLSAELTASLAQLRAHPVTQAGATTAEAAIRAGVADGWHDMLALRQRAVHILTAADALRPDPVDGKARDAALARFRNPLKVWPNALLWLRYGAEGTIEETGERIGTPPWPADLNDLPALVDYLTANLDVTPWTPTAAELEETIETWREAGFALTQQVKRPVSPAARDLIESIQAVPRTRPWRTDREAAH